MAPEADGGPGAASPAADRPARRRLSAPPLAVAAVLLLLSGLLWTQLDLDGDGLTTSNEWRHGTSPFRADSDRDGLADGWETARGLDPLHEDADRDGVRDGQEVLWGANPLQPDTDGDGIDDFAESPVDCNGDGILAIAQVDDDGDGRPDAEELPEHRCDPDVDGDGVLDGDEGHDDCVVLRDCDGDGLDDGREDGTAFDPLNADSFGTGLYDSVLWAFQEQGQAPSGDDDHDGIPDVWEGSSGLIEWGPYHPNDTRPDLLIEFVRVQGPDSGRYDWLDLSRSYRAVEDAIERSTDFEVQWVETTVDLPTEARPHVIPSRHTDHYEQVLDAAAHTTNSYVTTVVMNPQHDQSEILHLGAAPIRGMLAAVDYGAHTWIDFDFNGTTLRFSPFWESIVAGGRTDFIQAAGFQDGGESGGRYVLHADGFALTWRPDWFATAPRAEADSGAVVLSTRAGAGIDSRGLAHTILHELGHTLGLCHVEDAACRAKLSAADQLNTRSSTMHSGSDDGTLRFLPSEWDQVRTYVTCPPQEPIQLVAEGAEDHRILDAKYGYTLDEILDVGSRTCGEFVALERVFDHQAELFSHVPAPADRSPPGVTESVLGSVVYASLSAVVASGAGILAVWVRRDR